MSKPQVTITLGRTGRKVVKRPHTESGGSWTDSGPLSGRRRSTIQKFGSDTNGSLLLTNKRLRGDVDTCNPDYNRVNDNRVGQNDLRLKLMRKEQWKRIRSEVAACRKMELHGKMSRTIRSTGRRQLKHASPTKRAGGMVQAESLRKSYPSYMGDTLKCRSPERVLKVFQEVSPPRNIEERQQLASRRPSDAPRTGHILGFGLDPSRTIGPTTLAMGATYDAGKPVTRPPPESGLPSTSYIGEQPLTVSGLLHSLGLGKYAIHFQAEEVDMAALKQMGEKDLKELGIPMGPRKKILLALLPRSKQQPL